MRTWVPPYISIICMCTYTYIHTYLYIIYKHHYPFSKLSLQPTLHVYGLCKKPTRPHTCNMKHNHTHLLVHTSMYMIPTICMHTDSRKGQQTYPPEISKNKARVYICMYNRHVHGTPAIWTYTYPSIRLYMCICNRHVHRTPVICTYTSASARVYAPVCIIHAPAVYTAHMQYGRTHTYLLVYASVYICIQIEQICLYTDGRHLPLSAISR